MYFLDLFLWFILYSFIGWAWETVLFTIQERKFVNRGFLNGPICPIYGFGALFLLFALNHRTDNVIIIFCAAVVVTTALEYLTAVILEKVFNAKWWDYSMFPLNYQGRISVLSSAVFGVMAVLQIKYIHPFISSLTNQIPLYSKRVFLFIFIMYIFVDAAFTVRHVLILNGRLSEIQMALNAFFGKYYKRAGEFKNTLLLNFEESEFYSDRIRILFSLGRLQNTRIFKAFPKLRSIKYDDALKKLKDKLIGSRNKDGEE